MFDDDPRLDTETFRAKRAAANQRQLDRQNFIIQAVAEAVTHTSLEPINSMDEFRESFVQTVQQVDRESLFAQLPTSLTLFPLNVQDTHAVIINPGTVLL